MPNRQSKVSVTSIIEAVENLTHRKSYQDAFGFYIVNVQLSVQNIFKVKHFDAHFPSLFWEYQTIGGLVSKETVYCVGGKVKH